MTPQEFIDQNVRLLLGDLQLQIVMLKARIAELEQEREETSVASRKANGKDNEARLEGN
ncbi:MAG: hypothetical protein ABWY63_00715 [Hyphomicrobiaceae bacterium]